LSRSVGTAKALEMCVTGKPLTAAAALSAGLLDAVVDAPLQAAAVQFARNAAGSTHRRTRERNERLGDPPSNAPLFADARALAARTRRHQPAPLRAVDAIEAAATLPFDQGLRRERELFFECVQT